jgi:hypothetical protein
MPIKNDVSGLVYVWRVLFNWMHWYVNPISSASCSNKVIEKILDVLFILISTSYETQCQLIPTAKRYNYSTRYQLNCLTYTKNLNVLTAISNLVLPSSLILTILINPSTSSRGIFSEITSWNLKLYDSIGGKKYSENAAGALNILKQENTRLDPSEILSKQANLKNLRSNHHKK